MVSRTIILALVFAGLTISTTSQSFRLQALAPPECPDDGSHFFPDPEDCSAYYHCSFGTPHHQSCPDRLYWNQAIRSCDDPGNVECNEIPSSSSSSAATTIFPKTPPNRCPPEGVISLPIEGGNCKEYILCLEGVEYIRPCPAGTLFDPIDLRCKREEDVDCGQRTTTPGPSPTTSNPETTPDQTTSNPETTPGQTTSKSTLESETNPTTPEGEPSTTSPNPVNFSCPTNVVFIYMSHPEDCNLFYWCEHGVYKGTSNCGVNLWFSFLNQACVAPWSSECGTSCL